MTKRYVIGVDLGGTNIRASLITSENEVVEKMKEPTGKDPLAVLHKLLDSLYAPRAEEIGGIGIAVAGLVDRENGGVFVSPNIPALNGVNLAAELEEKYATCIAVENDANAAAYGEKVAGAGRNIGNFVMITLGTGIGGGIVIRNELLPVAAEIGHMSINVDGRPCPCGNVGCLELYASATAIIGNAVAELERGTTSILKELYNGNFYKISAEDIYRGALEGDPLSRTILREAGKSLGIGIASMINLFSPDAVILTGGLIGAWNIYVDAAIKEAAKRAMKELYGRVKIIPSSLGDDAGMIGAARLVPHPCTK
ncbi:MAG: ROK family protein [Alphaproteobacteria bacterium]|uniref:ROK family protein n=1 Tax=Candidatus Nitrobium versatile TaxID=2884831 RepID=A0A953M1M1_9BACT|nr:ROK family protein [Candidatus Nitrobium versatile]